METGFELAQIADFEVDDDGAVLAVGVVDGRLFQLRMVYLAAARTA